MVELSPWNSLPKYVMNAEILVKLNRLREFWHLENTWNLETEKLKDACLVVVLPHTPIKDSLPR